MKRIITCVLIAFTIALVNPLYAQPSQEKQDRLSQLEKQVTALKAKSDSAERALKDAKEASKHQPQEKVEAAKAAVDNAEKEYSRLYNDWKTKNKDLQDLRSELDAQANPENNDPTPLEVEEVNDSSMVAEAATDSTEVAEDAGVDDAEKPSLPWWLYLLMIGLPILCSVLVYFILNNKIDELKMRLRADSQATQRALNQRLDSMADKTDRIETSMRTVRQDMRNRDFVSPTPQPAPYGPTPQPAQPKRPTEFYLSMPSADGSWSEVSTVNTQGQCLYILNSPDGINGTFKVINEPIAIQMILMGVGKYLNPVCRVSNTASQVNGIVTDEPGTAVFENGVWRMTKKAVVHYV